MTTPSNPATEIERLIAALRADASQCVFENQSEVYAGALSKRLTEAADALTAEREARQQAEREREELTSAASHSLTLLMERDESLAALRAQLTASEQSRETLRTALGFDTPWPVVEVLRRLAAVAFHAREAHDCDHVGHEGDRYAAVEAKKMADRIDAALAASQPAGMTTKNDA